MTIGEAKHHKVSGWASRLPVELTAFCYLQLDTAAWFSSFVGPAVKIEQKCQQV